MKIQVGRDQATSKLRLTYGEKSVLTDSADVPPTVSPEHCEIDVEDNYFRLRNLNIDNYTYVNGQAVEAKTIQKTD